MFNPFYSISEIVSTKDGYLFLRLSLTLGFLQILFWALWHQISGIIPMMFPFGHEIPISRMWDIFLIPLSFFYIGSIAVNPKLADKDEPEEVGLLGGVFISLLVIALIISMIFGIFYFLIFGTIMFVVVQYSEEEELDCQC